jgi:FAD/FMN-containing dehydrogenase
MRPRSTEDVAKFLRLCHLARVAVTTQGGMTGLVRATMPQAGEIVLSMERMNAIEEVDTGGGVVITQTGVPLQRLQERVAEDGFMFPLDLGARGSCTIGGNISTNAGGNRVIRYGMTREMVLGLEVVLADGTILDSLNKMIKNNTGYDLKHLFIGAEGTLGVVTRAVLKLAPKPGCVAAAVCGLPDFSSVVRLLNDAKSGLGGTLSAFEVMWPRFYDLMTTKVAGVRAPLEGRHQRYVLIESLGSDDAIDGARFEAFLERMHQSGVIEDAAVARSTREVREFWAIRDAVAEFDHILGPHYGFDVGLPTGEMDSFVAEAMAALDERFPGMTTLCFGHVGDGNIHVVCHVPGLAKAPKAEFEKIVYGITRRRHGTISAEHGIGTARSRYLGYSRTPEEIAVMRAVKRALDPKDILNRGKVLPDLHAGEVPAAAPA